jgi:hypothetical protein
MRDAGCWCLGRGGPLQESPDCRAHPLGGRATVGTYIGVERSAGDAQTILDEYPLSAADGRCVACGIENCPPLFSALYLLASAGQLLPPAPRSHSARTHWCTAGTPWLTPLLPTTGSTRRRWEARIGGRTNCIPVQCAAVARGRAAASGLRRATSRWSAACRRET